MRTSSATTTDFVPGHIDAKSGICSLAFPSAPSRFAADGPTVVPVDPAAAGSFRPGSEVRRAGRRRNFQSVLEFREIGK